MSHIPDGVGPNSYGEQPEYNPCSPQSTNLRLARLLDLRADYLAFGMLEVQVNLLIGWNMLQDLDERGAPFFRSAMASRKTHLPNHDDLFVQNRSLRFQSQYVESRRQVTEGNDYL